MTRSVELERAVVASFRMAVEEIRGDVPDFVLDSPVADVGIDSLDVVEVGMIMEEEFDVELGDAIFEGVETVRDLLNVFVELISADAS